MKKDNFEKELQNRNDIDFSFANISDKIVVDTTEGKTISKRHPKLKIALPTVLLAVATVVALVVPLVNYYTPRVTELSITNSDDIVMEYEKNCAFIDKGFEVAKKKNNGEKEAILPDLYTIDSSKFVSGNEGTYPISIYLNSDKNIKTSFDVSVVDDEILSISLENYRSVYYIGESILNSDIIVNKECASGTTKEAKITEYEIDASLFNSRAIGTYEIKVTLISNPDFYLTYSVEVKSVEETDLTGRYAYKEPLTAGGEPTVFALEIEENFITSHYSEILIGGNMNKRIENGEIHISGDNGSSQTMIYIPEERTLLVSGIAGDPDLPCFKINRTDAMIRVDGEHVEDWEKEVEFVAVNGHMPSATIEYLTNRYGGVYLTSSISEKVTHQMEFIEDTVLYVGFKPIVDDQRPYLGKWFDDTGLVRLNLTETKADDWDYTVQKVNDNQYMIRSDNGSIFRYDLDKDTMSILTPEDYSVWIVLSHYVKGVQCLVTLNVSGSYIDRIVEYVVNKGDTLKTLILDETLITSYIVYGYENTPIMEDVAYGASVRTKYMIDIAGHYGNVKDYFEILGSWSAGRLDSNHSYWFMEYQNYAQTKMGWLEAIDATSDLGKITFLVHYDDGTTEELIYDGTLTLGEKTYNSKSHLWFGFSCLGQYENSEGETITIDDYGSFMYDVTTETGYVYQQYEHMRITSMSDTLITAEYVHQGLHDERIVKNATLELIEGKWVFTIDLGVYTQIV